ADGFDIDLQDEQARQQAAPAAESHQGSMMMRDAVASGPLMMGARFVPPPPGLSPAFNPGIPAAVKAPSPTPGPGTADWAKKQDMFQDLLAHPAAFMIRRTNLSSPAKLRGFLADRRRVRRYLDHPLIKAALSSPILLKTMLRTPGMVAAFLASPAMQDPRSVKALFESALVKEILAAEGPSALAKDDAFVSALVGDPATVLWMSRNPDAAARILRLAPGLVR
ncbi:MAG: hypothetical protein WC943_16380, partial [Elusimicrobiota bacterium]